MSDIHIGWTGVHTTAGWVGYAIACVLLPLFVLAFLLYLGYRLVTRKPDESVEVGWLPWVIWLAIIVPSAIAAYSL